MLSHDSLAQWDTAGQERFRSMSSTYYRGAHGMVLVFDITNRESFTNVGRWLAEIKKFAKDSVVSILVGNKSDLPTLRAVTDVEAKSFAQANGMVYVETSAKIGSNVESAFHTLATQIRRVREAPTPQPPNVQLSRAPPHKSCCGEERKQT
eukprot:c10697_g2_i1.p1 GENE.c10697_g2_i1~~c10697_g2_i1.p1  ORF type:complete len:151 (-),score=26.86 c10697_g2_i1:93-545(-)